MIVPQYWAEARIKDKVRGGQVTIKRYGWSDISLEDAQQNADTRAREAFERFVADPTVNRIERKVAYNGAEGVPIREEIVERRGETIVTRNGYGARCLNTPNVLFADIDFITWPSCGLVFVGMALLLAIAISIGLISQSRQFGVAAGAIALIFGYAIISNAYSLYIALRGGIEKISLNGLRKFVDSHPDWNVRIYRTPAGFRMLAMHRTFDPREEEVTNFFKAIGTDPIYMRMCWNQHCFRARVSAKPWRIGFRVPKRPSKGVWPISPEKIPDRNRWIEEYEQIAKGYASCQYVESLGSGVVNPTVRAVQQYHDELSKSNSTLAIA